MQLILKVVVFTLLTLGATAPTAQAVNFTAEEEPASFHGENDVGNETFSTEAGVVECDSTFSGEGEKSPTITVVPVYSNCEAFGFIDATPDLEGCFYVLELIESVDEHEHTATVAIQCPEGDSIKINALSCSAEIGPQGPLSHAIMTDTTNGFIDVASNIGDIDYTVTKDGFLCPFKGTGAKEGGEITTAEPAAIGSEQGIHIG